MIGAVEPWPIDWLDAVTSVSALLGAGVGAVVGSVLAGRSAARRQAAQHLEDRFLMARDLIAAEGSEWSMTLGGMDLNALSTELSAADERWWGLAGKRGAAARSRAALRRRVLDLSSALTPRRLAEYRTENVEDAEIVDVADTAPDTGDVDDALTRRGRAGGRAVSAQRRVKVRTNPDGSKTALVTPSESQLAKLQVSLERQAGRTPEPWLVAIAEAKPATPQRGRASHPEDVGGAA